MCRSSSSGTGAEIASEPDGHGHVQRSEQVPNVARRCEVLVLIGDTDLLDALEGSIELMTAATTSSGADAPAVTPTVPPDRRQARPAPLMRYTRGQPASAASLASALVLDELAEPMTRIASHRSAIAISAD